MNSEPASFRAPSTTLVIATIGTLTIIRLVVGLNYDLFQDEAFYAWIGKRDLLNFSPHPPGVPLFVRVGIALFGKNEAGVRFVSFLLMSLALVPIWLLARRILGDALGRWALIAVASVPIYMAFGAIATPDGPQLFVWSVALYSVWRALESDRIGWWLATGTSVGLGLFIKYILILFYPSLILCLLLPSPLRKRLKSPGPYVAAAVSFLIFVPFAAWRSYLEGWAALRYHLSARQTFMGFSPLAEGVYQAVHLAYISPLLYVGSLIAIVWAGVNGVRRHDARLIFLFSFSAVGYVFFAIAAGFTRRDLSREQWDALTYVTAIMAAVPLADQAAARFAWVRRLAIAAPILGAVTVVIFAEESCFGGISRFVGRPPAAGLMGWREMAGAIDSKLATFNDGKAAFVLTSSFVPAVQYAFYGKATDRVQSLDSRDTIRFGLNDLLHKYGMSQDELPSEAGMNAIFAVEEYPDADSGFSEQTTRRDEKLNRLFSKVEALPPVVISRFGKTVKRFCLYKCYDLRAQKKDKPQPESEGV